MRCSKSNIDRILYEAAGLWRKQMWEDDMILSEAKIIPRFPNISLVFERLRKQFPEIILEILPFVMSQSKSMSLWHLFKDKGPPNAPKAKYSA